MQADPAGGRHPAGPHATAVTGGGGGHLVSGANIVHLTAPPPPRAQQAPPSQVQTIVPDEHHQVTVAGAAGGPGDPVAGGTHTITFTDSEGNVITSLMGDASILNSLGGMTVVGANDMTLGPHFLSPMGPEGVSLKLEPVGPDPSGAVVKQQHQLEVVADPTVIINDGTAAAAAQPPMEVMGVKKKFAGGGSSGPETQKRICLWPMGNGTTCGKAFAKFDSLKRHLTEAHKGVRPFACKLCDKTYGRRDYLQRHLKSHNASYAVNLAGGNAATLSSYNAATKSIKLESPPSAAPQQPPQPLPQQQPTSQTNQQQQQTMTASVSVSNAANATSTATTSNSVSSSSNNVNSMPLLNLYTMHNQPAPKPLGSKICRWVQDDGTVCGKAFSKLDSLRRHVNELHKGVRPYACSQCDKNYGRKDYLDRHVKTHDPANQKRKPGIVDWGTGSGVVSLLNSIKEDANAPPKPKSAKKKRRDIPAEEERVCLWLLEDGTACGKTFTKSDSLKRHVAEGHKNVRPFGCTLCGKSYGRRDYLLRHLRSHNDADLANLAAHINEKTSPTPMVVSDGNLTSSSGGGMMVSASASSGMGGTGNPLLSGLPNSNPHMSGVTTSHHQQETSSTVINNSSSSAPLGTVAPSEINRMMSGIQQASAAGGIAPAAAGGGGGSLGGKLGMKKRSNDKKTCRWVLDNGTVCGRAFSKFDSLRRHVTELHKGVRPFACKQCDKTYGRKDYLDRHVKSHTAAAEAAAAAAGGGTTTAASAAAGGGAVVVPMTSSAAAAASVEVSKTSLIVHNDNVLASEVMMDDDDEDEDEDDDDEDDGSGGDHEHHMKTAAALMSTDVVNVVGAVDDEDDELAV